MEFIRGLDEHPIAASTTTTTTTTTTGVLLPRHRLSSPRSGGGGGGGSKGRGYSGSFGGSFDADSGLSSDDDSSFSYIPQSIHPVERHLQHVELNKLSSYQTRDLFASHAARLGSSPASISSVAARNLYRPRSAVLSAPLPCHPSHGPVDAHDGLPHFSASQHDELSEARADNTIAAHRTRRQRAQQLQRDIAAKVDLEMERRMRDEEESQRKIDDKYNRIIQKQLDGTFEHASSHSSTAGGGSATGTAAQPTRTRPISAPVRALPPRTSQPAPALNSDGRNMRSRIDVQLQALDETSETHTASHAHLTNVARFVNDGSPVQPHSPSSLHATLPIVDAHYTAEAWSSSVATQQEIDDMQQRAETKAPHLIQTQLQDPDEDPTYSPDNLLRLNPVARRQMEKQRAERKVEYLQSQAEARRHMLQHKTHVWPTDNMGIIAIGAGPADMAPAGEKARNKLLKDKNIAAPAKVPQFDVAFGRSVIVRNEKKTKKSGEADKEKSEQQQSARPKRVVKSGSTKKAPVNKGPAPSIARTLEHVKSEGKLSTAFTNQLANLTLEHHVEEAHDMSFSPLRKNRASSSSASASSLLGKPSDAKVAWDPHPSVPAPRIRPATAHLIGTALSHSSVFPPEQVARESSSLHHHVEGHLQRVASRQQIEHIKYELMRHSAASNDGHFQSLPISTAALESALMPPEVQLTAEQRALYPKQITALMVNPFHVPKKKKKKLRKGSKKKGSKKKSSSKKKGSKKKGKKGKDGTSTTAADPSCLALPDDSPYASNPLAEDLEEITLGPLMQTPQDVEKVQHILLNNADHLRLIFEYYTNKADKHGTLNPFQFFQFCSICALADSAMSLSQIAALLPSPPTSLVSFSLCQSMSRPVFLHTLLILAHAKFPSLSLGESVDLVITQCVLPHAFSVPPTDVRTKMLTHAPLMAAIQQYEAQLFAMFQCGVDVDKEKNGGRFELSHSGLDYVLRNCGLSLDAPWVRKASHASLQAQGVYTANIIFTTFIELFVRLAEQSISNNSTGPASPSNSDTLAATLQSFIAQCWSIFQRQISAANQSAKDIGSMLAAAQQSAKKASVKFK